MKTISTWLVGLAVLVAAPPTYASEITKTTTTVIAVVGVLGGAVLAYSVVSPVLLFSPVERDPVTVHPWYRGDADSKLRLRYDFGSLGVLIKAPLNDRELIGLRFEIRF